MNNVHGTTGSSAVAWDRRWSQATISLDLFNAYSPCGKGSLVVLVSPVMRHCARNVERCASASAIIFECENVKTDTIAGFY